MMGTLDTTQSWLSPTQWAILIGMALVGVVVILLAYRVMRAWVRRQVRMELARISETDQ